jgi:hypothetical protein
MSTKQKELRQTKLTFGGPTYLYSTLSNVSSSSSGMDEALSNPAPSTIFLENTLLFFTGGEGILSFSIGIILETTILLYPLGRLAHSL